MWRTSFVIVGGVIGAVTGTLSGLDGVAWMMVGVAWGVAIALVDPIGRDERP